MLFHVLRAGNQAEQVIILGTFLSNVKQMYRRQEGKNNLSNSVTLTKT